MSAFSMIAVMARVWSSREITGERTSRDRSSRIADHGVEAAQVLDHPVEELVGVGQLEKRGRVTSRQPARAYGLG